MGKLTVEGGSILDSLAITDKRTTLCQQWSFHRPACQKLTHLLSINCHPSAKPMNDDRHLIIRREEEDEEEEEEEELIYQ
ncbi:hypothetical protein T4D_2563 [Trichinella pseudospiralis]|uniref:Uncharacterized protein n=1 Tax=Trichinella pseudospiralis TaxID=6337 RepID=A0A0V1FX51_TRIPS|nr:hypothetical protein T4D_2563 [Trichinella pseudospiralis]